MFYSSLHSESLFIPQSQFYSSAFSHCSIITFMAKESYLLRQCLARINFYQAGLRGYLHSNFDEDTFTVPVSALDSQTATQSVKS